MAIARQAILDGTPVVLEEICTIEPYVKAATRGYNPFYDEMRPIPERRYIRFEPSVGLVKALKDSKVNDAASSEKGR